MGDRFTVVERMSQETLLDAAGHIHHHTLRCTSECHLQRTNSEVSKLPKRLLMQPITSRSSDNGQDLAIEYIKREYIHRLRY